MKITRNVVLDLLPLYHAGEASADTRELVDEFFRQDPEFARTAREMVTLSLDAIPMELAQDHEVKTLERTKQMIRLRTWMMGFAIFFSLLPLSTVFSDHITWVMLRDAPVLAAGCFVVGVSFWIAYYLTGRRLRSTSL